VIYELLVGGFWELFRKVLICFNDECTASGAGVKHPGNLIVLGDSQVFAILL
jgi:hypothetical protein